MSSIQKSLANNDGKRLCGPGQSVPYSVFQEKPQKPESHSDERSDGRQDSEHRKIFLSTGVISKAKGSAYIEQGNTKLIVGVFGPKEVQKRSEFSVSGSLSTEFKFAPFSSDKRRGGHKTEDREEEELSLVVSEALSSTVCLNKYPKSVIEVGVTVIEDDGAVVAAALTAAGLALADAGIHMYDLVLGVKVALTCDQETVRVTVDPDRGEEQMRRGEMTLGYLPSLEQAMIIYRMAKF